jgi:hypothetical protein
MGTDSSLSNANQTSVLICLFDLGLHKGAQIIRTETCGRFLGVTINHWNTAKNQPKKSSSIQNLVDEESFRLGGAIKIEVLFSQLAFSIVCCCSRKRSKDNDGSS